MIKKIYTKMHSEKCYVKLKLNKLKDFIQSDLFKKILSEEMQEIKICLGKWTLYAYYIRKRIRITIA